MPPSPSPTSAPNTTSPVRVDAPPTTRRVSIITPAYREAENLPELISRIAPLRLSPHHLDLELIIVNDESGDDTAAVVRSAAQPWVRLLTRSTERGLSSAVVHGLNSSRHDYLIVMDADLSHPPESIPKLLDALDEGAAFAFGSRYIRGGSTDDRWTLPRALNSRVATLLARPLTDLKDPMSGFFALRRETLAATAPLNPVGYKIGLELLVKSRVAKSRARPAVEVPIHFASRTRGESKLTIREKLLYLIHLSRMLRFQLTKPE